MSHRYKLNAFVTALHERFQLSNEVRTNCHPIATTLKTDVDEDTAAAVFFQKYGRHPRHVRKHDFGRGATYRRPARQRHDGSSRSTSEARRLNLCFKCDAPWTPRHRCDDGAIRTHARNRLRRGDSHVHIVRDLVLGMEGESTDSIQDDNHSMEGGSTDSHVLFTDDALREFDDAFEDASKSPPYETSFADTLDENITTHVFSAHMYGPNAHSGFQ